MQQVISATQARSILGGRTPLMPVEYEKAVKSLAACLTLDEARYWDNKADALAAWAKIYHSPDAERKAKQLKLHAYRRMGQLAYEIAAAKRKKHKPQVLTVLAEAGLTRTQVRDVRSVSRLPKERFTAITERPQVPSPSAVRRITQSGSDQWKVISTLGSGPTNFRSFCRSHNPAELATGLTPDEREKARAIAIEIAEWVDQFERHLR